MSFLNVSAISREIRTLAATTNQLPQILKTFADKVGARIECDALLVALDSKIPGAKISWTAPGFKYEPQNLFVLAKDGVSFEGQNLHLPIFVSDVGRSTLHADLISRLSIGGTRSIAVLPIFLGASVAGWVEVHYCRRFQRFRGELMADLGHLVDSLGLCLEIALLRHRSRPGEQKSSSPVSTGASLASSRAGSSDLPAEFMVEQGDIIIIRTDAQRRIVEIQGETNRLLGLSADELKNDPDVWRRIFHSEDLAVLGRKLKACAEGGCGISEEVRVINRETAELRWFMVRAIPILDSKGQLLGFEGFGLDITDKIRTQQELVDQSKRVEALYEVSRALEVSLDPALVTLRGLRALINATNSDCGFGCFYDSAAQQLELVAAEGLSQSYIDALNSRINSSTLVQHVAKTGEGLLISNIQLDTRAAVDIAKSEGLKSSIIVPMAFEGQVLGALVLFCRKANRFSEADFDLVSAAASQIALAARQAEFYVAEKRHANSMAVLYRLSHELSKLMTPSEVAEHAFPIIQKEILCKRMWLGVLNDQGTHIVGHGGFGPGIRREIVEIQVELNLRHDFLDEAIKTKQAVVVKPGQQMECSGLNKFMAQLNPGMFIVMPLISLGQVVGVMIVEPAVPSAFTAQRKLPLLTSMANEIATVILARRFESKIADADKMRMAGMLASGVAHNFNNVLQAVMGQASLIEMQAPADSLMAKSAQTIIDSAGKGASLIRQMLTFTTSGGAQRQELAVAALLSESRELYESILGLNITLDVSPAETPSKIMADPGQLQQVLTNLLMNARDAIGNKESGRVEVITEQVRLGSGEVHPELAPGAYLRIDIEDNGIGMDQDRQARCFEPFYTTKNVDSKTGLGFHGSGLGLSSAYSIVKQHDGIITLRSTPGQGTVFSIYLPLARSSGGAAGDDRILVSGAAEVVTINLADKVSLAVTSSVESLGLSTKVFDSRERGIEYLRNSLSTPKLVLLDAERTGSEALILVKEVRSIQPDARIMVATVEQKRWDLLTRTMASIDVLEKPISNWSLRAALRRALFGGAGELSDQITVEISTDSKNGAKPKTTVRAGIKSGRTKETN